ncbi:QRFP-like peptide receptor [Ptychodera flava]|uniref:QRFP-like peptide receptor n=1 Tax=Ptychodera flava TaxID=63121 RepID=UPI00396A8894
MSLDSQNETDGLNELRGEVARPDTRRSGDWLVGSLNTTNAILIIGGNLLVLVAIFRQQKLRNSATNHLIASLSLSDIFVGAVFIPVKSAKLFGVEWLVTEFLCDSVLTVSWTFLNSTIFTLLCIAIDRYRAIVTPMKRQISINQARMMILLAWSLAFIYSSNLIVVNGITSRAVEIAGQNFTDRGCGYLVSEKVEVVAVLDFVLFYFLPLIVLTVLYSKMITVLYFGNSPNDSSRRRKRRAVRMLIVVVVMFAITWCPIRSLRMMRYALPRLMPESKYMEIRPIIVAVALTNSWMNPIIYAIFGANFRREFANILGCGLKNGGDIARRDRDGQRRSNEKKIARTESNVDSVTTPEPKLARENDPPYIVEGNPSDRRTTATQTEDRDPDSSLHCQCHENVGFEISPESRQL